MTSVAKKTILVTGGAGFLGSHLCDRLLEGGHAVICLDDFSTGSARNIEHLIGHPRFSLVEQDVTLSLAPHAGALDQIYNLACPASPVHYQRDPVRTTRTIVLGALNVLDLARVTGARILQASTSEVYGDPAVHPQVEPYWGNVNPIGLRSCYDEGKRCAESLFFDYHRQYGVVVKVVRIFNTYGPRMQVGDGRVMSNFIVQALRGEPLTIYGRGQQTRSFCHVSDLIEAMIRMMNTDASCTGPVNIGNPVEVTMLELAERVLRQVGSASRLAYLPAPADDPVRRRPDISLADHHLEWAPVVDLDVGVADTVAWFRRCLAVDARPDDDDRDSSDVAISGNTATEVTRAERPVRFGRVAP
jgi:UDP-glucuronate decarboxylase